MQGKLVKIEKYGETVFANQQTEDMRRGECLCFNCASLPSCPAAKIGLALCQTYNIAFLVTRCPVFIPHNNIQTYEVL
jgi:hypothetical protein